MTDEPQVTDEQIEESVPDVGALQAERDELFDRLQRLAAEFDNFRKRNAREQASLVERANERLVKELLPVLDDLVRINALVRVLPDQVAHLVDDRGHASHTADEARRLHEVADTKNMAETLAYQTERSLKEHRSAIDESDASTIEGRIMELRQALESEDVADIKAKTEALQEASHKLAEAVYASAQQAQTASAQSGGNGAASSDDEVVEEADYEVIDEEQEAPKA